MPPTLSYLSLYEILCSINACGRHPIIHGTQSLSSNEVIADLPPALELLPNRPQYPCLDEVIKCHQTTIL